MPKLRLNSMREATCDAMRSTPALLAALMAAAAAAIAVAPAASHAQTIADLSRAQRQVMEAEIARSHQRILSFGALGAEPHAGASPGVGLPTLPNAKPALPAGASPSAGGPSEPPLKPPRPALALAGVFISANQALAQINLGEHAHWLHAGERIPGTAWAVQSIGAQQVVLVGAGRARAAHRVLRLHGRA